MWRGGRMLIGKLPTLCPGWCQKLAGGDKRQGGCVPVFDFCLISWQLYLSKSPVANANTNYRFVEDCRADFSF